MALEFGPAEKRAALLKIASNLEELERLAAKAGEGFLAYLIAQSKGEAQVRSAALGSADPRGVFR